MRQDSQWSRTDPENNLFTNEDYDRLYHKKNGKIVVGVDREHLDLYDDYKNCNVQDFQFNGTNSMAQHAICHRFGYPDWSVYQTLLPGISAHAGSGVSRKLDYIFGIYVHDEFCYSHRTSSPAPMKKGKNGNVTALPFQDVNYLLKNEYCLG